ncbi:ribosome silencing factor [Comamonas granuli]|uniref:ribosome silencing factor n=1 Tax=Comamonas granuli TaxID=290309 RepID=UPI0005A7373E|nr:ribosome silencing factor [Comamonas granuli]
MTTTISSESAAKKNVAKLQRAIVDGLEDIKAQDIQVFNTEHLSPLFERVIVASGTSNRQTKALAASVIDKVREAGFPKPRVEGEDNGEWIIVDCGAAVAHVMQPAIRQYYRLEELWGEVPVRLKLGAAKPVAVKKAPAKAAGTAPAAKKAAAKKAPAKKTAAPKTAATKTAAAKTAAAPKAPARRTAQSAAPSTAKPAAKRATKPAAGSAAKPAAKAPARKTASTTARKTAAPRAGTTAVQKLVVQPRKAAAPAKAGAAAKAPARKAPARKSAAPR